MTDNFSIEFFRSCERLKTNIFIIFHHIASCFIHIGSKTTSKHPTPLCLWWHLVFQQPKSETSLRTIQKPSSQLRLWGRWSLTQTRMKHIGEDDNILIKQLSHLRNWLSLFLYIQIISNYTIPKVGKFKATCLCLGRWYGGMVCPVLDILDGQVRAWLRNCSQSKPRTCYLRCAQHPWAQFFGVTSLPPSLSVHVRSCRRHLHGALREHNLKSDRN